MIRITSILAVAFALVPATAAAQSPVEVRTALSRTAVWLGDRVIYTVELRCAPDVDILADDLAAERLQIDGADIAGVDSQTDDNGRVRVRRMRYTLVTYRVDVPDVRIAAIPVRYYVRRTGGDSAQIAPAGQVTVPATVVAVRSTLPDTGGVPAPRAPASLRESPRYLAFAQPAGLILIALVIIPLAIAGLDVGGRAKRAWGRQQVRRVRRRQTVSLDHLDALDVVDANRVEAFAQLDTLVREHLALTTGIPAHALTPAEVRRELEPRAPALPHHDIESLLAACEEARYAPEPPSADRWRNALRDAAQVLRGGRR